MVQRALSALLLLIAAAARAGEETPPARALPFTTEETSGTVKLKLRHRVEWNRTTGEYQWDRLEAEMPGHFSVSLEPGRWNPREEREQEAAVGMRVRGGEASGSGLRRPDGSWLIRAKARLEPREFAWHDPAVRIHGLSVDGELALDSLLTSGPLQMIRSMSVRTVGMERVEAGAYTLEGLKLSGAWDRPAWSVEKLQAGVFGGRIELAGRGRWGTNEPPEVSVTLKGESLDFHELLKSFSVPRADQIRGRISGRMRVEAVGRDWKVMAFDIGGDEGTVQIDRRMISDIISYSYSLGMSVSDPKVRELLDGMEAEFTKSYGKAPLVPMREMRIQGSLEPERLHVWIPIRSADGSVSILLEPLIERGIVWDSWDYLVKAGAENVRGMNVDAAAERVPEAPAPQ